MTSSSDNYKAQQCMPTSLGWGRKNTCIISSNLPCWFHLLEYKLKRKAKQKTSKQNPQKTLTTTAAKQKQKQNQNTLAGFLIASIPDPSSSVKYTRINSFHQHNNPMTLTSYTFRDDKTGPWRGRRECSC